MNKYLRNVHNKKVKNFKKLKIIKRLNDTHHMYSEYFLNS